MTELPFEWQDRDVHGFPSGGVVRTHVAWCRCGWHYAATPDRGSEGDATRALDRHREQGHPMDPEHLLVCSGSMVHSRPMEETPDA